VPRVVRERIEADLNRRSKNAVANARARVQEADRLAEAGDDRVIALMNAQRAEEGKGPLSEQQEASIRENRRRRRESKA
jgi:hypothetical protein